jgi:CelD/BcsL family acetyltransferase involved in cellulose biosynthesis
MPVTVTMTFDVKIAEGPDAFDISSWRALLEKDPNASIFATPEWHRVWWEEFSEGKDLFVLTMSREEEVRAIVPLYRKEEGGRKVLRFVGGIDLTDYVGPICAAEDRLDVADGLVSWLLTTDVEWDEFDAHNMPVPFGFAEYLVERADDAGLRFALDQEETSAILKLPSDWDSYLASLDSKERHELKRKQRRIGREHPDATVRTSTPETLDADLKIFVDMHRGTEGLKGHFMRPEIATFFERVARAFSKLGWLRMDFLEVGGTAIATSFGFEHGNTLYLYNSAFEPEAKRLSPGLILVVSLIEEAIEKGMETFDLLRGPERYKYQLGAEAVPLNNLRMFRPGVAN